jgi:hypothetical protein
MLSNRLESEERTMEERGMKARGEEREREGTRENPESEVRAEKARAS